MSETNPEPAPSSIPGTLLPRTLLPSNFGFGHVVPILNATAPPGPLAAFTGTFAAV
jgi:hypothetical protein